jgi:MFS family permease
LESFAITSEYSPFHAALFMLPISISAFVAGSLNGFVLHKIGVGRALWTSLIVSAIGLIGYAFFRNSSAIEQVASFVILGFGVGARTNENARSLGRPWSGSKGSRERVAPPRLFLSLQSQPGRFEDRADELLQLLDLILIILSWIPYSQERQ